jgi:hypothetical protein
VCTRSLRHATAMPIARGDALRTGARVGRGDARRRGSGEVIPTPRVRPPRGHSGADADRAACRARGRRCGTPPLRRAGVTRNPGKLESWESRRPRAADRQVARFSRPPPRKRWWPRQSRCSSSPCCSCYNGISQTRTSTGWVQRTVRRVPGAVADSATGCCICATSCRH